MNLDNHLAEGASLTLDQEIDDTLEENAEHVLEEIDDALARIDAGSLMVSMACSVVKPRSRPRFSMCAVS